MFILARILPLLFLVVFTKQEEPESISRFQTSVPKDIELNNVRNKRNSWITDYDGTFFSDKLTNTDYNLGKHTEAVQEHQLQRIVDREPRIKTDPEFDRKLQLAQDTFGFSPFLRTFIKYFIKNREQREKRDANYDDYGDDRVDYYGNKVEDYEQYEGNQHHFKPIPVF